MKPKILHTLKRLESYAFLWTAALPFIGYYLLDWQPEGTILFFMLENIIILVLLWLFVWLWAIMSRTNTDRLTFLAMGLVAIPGLFVFLGLILAYLVGLVVFQIQAEFPKNLEIQEAYLAYEGFKPLFYVQMVWDKMRQHIFSDWMGWTDIATVALPHLLGLTRMTFRSETKTQKLKHFTLEGLQRWGMSFFVLFLAIWLSGVFQTLMAALVWFALAHIYSALQAADKKNTGSS